jgi:sec-independent protein translocase protein TatB
LTATDQIKDSLGPGYENLKPEDLHPKTFIKKQLNEALKDDVVAAPRKVTNAKIDPEML